jgi:hypothetical protein
MEVSMVTGSLSSSSPLNVNFDKAPIFCRVTAVIA